MNVKYNGTNEYKAIELLIPVDTEVVSVTVVRNGSDMPNRSTSIIASCFPADVDLHDCVTGYSYRKDEEGKLYMVYDVDDEYGEYGMYFALSSDGSLEIDAMDYGDGTVCIQMYWAEE